MKYIRRACSLILTVKSREMHVYVGTHVKNKNLYISCASLAFVEHLWATCLTTYYDKTDATNYQSLLRNNKPELCKRAEENKIKCFVKSVDRAFSYSGYKTFHSPCKRVRMDIVTTANEISKFHVNGFFPMGLINFQLQNHLHHQQFRDEYLM